MRREVRDFMRDLERKGWHILRHTGTGHIKMQSPTGATTIFPATPSDGRWIKNKRAEIRRLERI